jgi:hypothetical protein
LHSRSVSGRSGRRCWPAGRRSCGADGSGARWARSRGSALPVWSRSLNGSSR